jgi:hypothetical protein
MVDGRARQRVVHLPAAPGLRLRGRDGRRGSIEDQHRDRQKDDCEDWSDGSKLLLFGDVVPSWGPGKAARERFAHANATRLQLASRDVAINICSL